MRLNYRVLIPAICVVTALLLSISLLHYGAYSWLSPQDDLIQKPHAVFSFSETVADFAGPCDMKHPCAVFSQSGIFALAQLPFWISLLGGLMVPLFLILGAVAIAINNRWASIVLLCVAAFFCAETMIAWGSRFVIFHNSIVYSFDDAKVVRFKPNGVAVYDFSASPVAEMPIARTIIERGGNDMGTVSGFYLRADVPRAFGLIAGIIAPLLLLLSAVALAIRTFFTYRRSP